MLLKKICFHSNVICRKIQSNIDDQIQQVVLIKSPVWSSSSSIVAIAGVPHRVGRNSGKLNTKKNFFKLIIQNIEIVSLDCPSIGIQLHEYRQSGAGFGYGSETRVAVWYKTLIDLSLAIHSTRIWWAFVRTIWMEEQLTGREHAVLWLFVLDLVAELMNKSTQVAISLFPCGGVLRAPATYESPAAWNILPKTKRKAEIMSSSDSLHLFRSLIISDYEHLIRKNHDK